MTKFNHLAAGQAAVLAGLLALPAAATNLPDAIAVSGETLVATVQAAGSQVYECTAEASGKLTWQFREPVATLVTGGRTVGRHFAGPHWEMEDGSAVSAKPTGRAPGASEDDIPLLRLEVVSRRGSGQLDGVTTVLRLNTKGGAAAGACETAGALQNVPYTADYAFYRKADSGAGAAAAAPAASRPASVRSAPAAVAVPVAMPAVSVIVLPHDIPRRPKKKSEGEPKSPGQPKPKTAEPKTPPPAQPKSGGPVVRDHREKVPVVRDHRENAPVVRDHRKPLQGGVSVSDAPERRTNTSDRGQRGSVLTVPRSVLCGTPGLPLCRSR